MNILECVNKNKEQMIKDMQGLLRIDATLVESPDNLDAPFGEGIKNSLLYMLDLGKKMGFKVENYKNIAGHIECGEGEKLIGILVHVDTVPAAGKWKYPPFSATMEGSKLYSRGASDDKGPAISSLYALKVLKDLGIKLNSRVRLIIGTDEETAWRCINSYFKDNEMPDLGFSPDADFPVIYGEKGIMSIDIHSSEKADICFKAGVRYNVVPDEATFSIVKDLTKTFNLFLEENKLDGSVDTMKSEYKVFGKTAHAMEPDAGVNAIIKSSLFLREHSNNRLIKFIAENLTDSRFKQMNLNFSDPELKDLTVNVALLNINDNSGKLGLNLRYPINWDKEEFLKDFSRVAEEYGLTIKVVADQKPHYVSKEDPLVTTLHEAYKYYTNDITTPLLTIGGGTYARALKKGVAFGVNFPGTVEVAHQPDEFIDLDDITKATAIIAKAVKDLAN